VIYKKVRLENNYLVDKSEYDIHGVKLLKYGTKVLTMENEIFRFYFPDLYRRGIYIAGDKVPLIPRDVPIIGNNLKEYIINDLETLEKVFKECDEIKIGSEKFSKKAYLLNEKDLTLVSRFPIITSFVLKYLEEYYMTTLNSERCLVLDKQGINLIDCYYFTPDHTFKNLEEFLEAEVFSRSSTVLSNELKDEITENYHEFINGILEELNDISQTLSIRITARTRDILITYFAPPSSRRYWLERT